MIKCPRCPAEWGGTRTGHCTACHETFVGEAAFDRHRDGSHARGERYCRPPGSVRLVDADRAYPCWTIPGVVEPEEEGQL